MAVLQVVDPNEDSVVIDYLIDEPDATGRGVGYRDDPPPRGESLEIAYIAWSLWLIALGVFLLL